MSNLDYRSYIIIIDNRLNGIYEKSFQQNLLQLRSLLHEKDDYSSISKDEYRICFLFQIYLRRILFERKTKSLILHHQKWIHNLDKIRTDREKFKVIKTYRAKLILQLKTMAYRYNLSNRADDLFSEQLLLDIFYPIRLEGDKLNERLRILKKIQTGEMSKWNFFKEFTYLETFQENLLENLYLSLLLQELTPSDKNLNTINYYLDIFIDKYAFQLFEKVINNRHTFISKIGPAFYSKIFHLFIDENLIYSNASKTAYCNLIRKKFNIKFKQFDIRTMYGESERAQFLKLKNA